MCRKEINNSSNTNTITTFHFMHSGKMFASVQNHKILNLIGIVSIAVAFVTSVIFNALAGSGELNILIIVLFIGLVND